MPQKTKLSAELRSKAKEVAREARGEFKQIASDLAKASCALYKAGMEKEAKQLQARSFHYVNSVLNTREFMEQWTEWAFENPGQAMRDVANMGSKNVKIEGDIEHKHFIITQLEDPGSWERKVIDVTPNGETLPWENK